ncbi:MAG TPA: hypothetical protein DCM62_02350, partial [Bacteroidales bacterium]|nr:hypothetical protein [Bacteroidales bacterium]
LKVGVIRTLECGISTLAFLISVYAHLYENHNQSTFHLILASYFTTTEPIKRKIWNSRNGNKFNGKSCEGNHACEGLGMDYPAENSHQAIATNSWV